MSSESPRGGNRRLRYFTFCAAGALDVLTLDVDGIFGRSEHGFENVVFFDRNSDDVFRTQKRIPGATGYAGNFTELVLQGGPEFDPTYTPVEALSSDTDLEETEATRHQMRLKAERVKLIREFPFDVINLDLEQFLFRPGDPFPGKMLQALRHIFMWQQQSYFHRKKERSLKAFTLFFTTQVGPQNLGAEYVRLLKDRIADNIARDQSLSRLLAHRTGLPTLDDLQKRDFETFFRIGVPKIVSHALLDEDWYVQDDPGILMYEFERPSDYGPYRMLHLIMHVRRQHPPKNRRGPGDQPKAALDSHHKVAQAIFAKKPIHVTLENIATDDLASHLDRVRARGRKYDEGIP